MSILNSLCYFRQLLLRSTSSQSIHLNNNLSAIRRYGSAVKIDHREEIKPRPTPFSSVLSLIQFEEKKLEEVGISERIGRLPKLVGLIQDRCFEFQVHEIDSNGKRVELTDILPESDNEELDKQYLYTRKTQFGIKHCGKKDKNAETSQRMCILNFDGAIDILLQISMEPQSNIRLGNFEYCNDPIMIGQNLGNQFEILLKNLRLVQDSTTKFSENVAATCEVLDDALKSFSDKGLINYFGLQRFGVNAHQIGINVLKERWEKVFDLILEQQPSDKGVTKKLKALWAHERNPDKMLALIQSKKRFDLEEAVQLVRGLSLHYNKGKGDLAQAYEQIHWEYRSIHLSAFISYIWNHVASFRIKKYGLSVLPGDYVYVKDDSSFEGCSESELISLDDNNDNSGDRKTKILTPLDVESGKYSIYDVLLPTLGYTIPKYPNQKLQECCSKLLDTLGLDDDCFSNFKKSLLRKNLLRPLVVKPFDVSCKIIEYNNNDYLSELMPSDWDRINDQVTEFLETDKSRNDNSSVDTNSTTDDNVECIDEDTVKDKICAVIKFSLPTSAYATVALRELAYFYKPSRSSGEV